MKRFRSVDDYIQHKEQWQEALVFLREIILSTELEETLKWGFPVYTIGGKNVVGLAAYKPYVGLWFFQGALLKDAAKKLVNAQEGRTKAMRQLRFSSMNDIDARLVKTYLVEAIDNQKSGREIKPEKKKAIAIPDLLANAFQEDKTLADCFRQLTASKQREYAEYINGAKQEATRHRRLQKIIPMILKKTGLHDKYKSC